MSKSLISRTINVFKENKDLTKASFYILLSHLVGYIADISHERGDSFSQAFAWSLLFMSLFLTIISGYYLLKSANKLYQIRKLNKEIKVDVR